MDCNKSLKEMGNISIADIKKSPKLTGKLDDTESFWYFLDETLYIEGHTLTPTHYEEYEEYNTDFRMCIGNRVRKLILDVEECLGIDMLGSLANLTSLYLTDKVKRIFGGFNTGKEYLQNLDYIYVAEGNPYMCSIDGILYSKDQKKLILYPRVKEGNYFIPEMVNKVGSAAFVNCRKIRKIVIPKSVTEIARSAFYRCSADIELEDSDAHPLYQQIQHMLELRKQGFPEWLPPFDPVTYQMNNGVYYFRTGKTLCYFPNIRTGYFKIPSCVEEIASDAFIGCKDLFLVIPPSIRLVKDYAFCGCDFDILRVAKNIELEPNAFCDCTVKTLDITENTNPFVLRPLNTYIVDTDHPFYTSKEGILYNKNMTKLLRCPSNKAGIFKIPDGVKSIDSCAFWGCKKLDSVIVPDSVADIGWVAFKNVPHIIYHGPAQSDDNWGALSRN